jgi:NitT/TauT family transport system permease protein
MLDFTIPLATLATVGRIFLLIGVSIVSGWILAYFAIRSRRFENIYIPLVNVFESIPVIGFLPVVLALFVITIPGTVGIELAVDFLVFDAVVWNIWIGAYQAFKTVPEPLLEVSSNYGFSTVQKMRELFIPHSIPRLVSNIFSSFADGFFYISVSEVFTAGVVTARVCSGGTCSTFGIGSEIVKFLAEGNYLGVYYSLLAIAVAVITVTILLSMASRWAIAKFGIDTLPNIKHERRRFQSRSVDLWRRRLRRQKRLIEKEYKEKIGSKIDQDIEDFKVRSYHWLKLLGISIGVLIIGYLVYSAAKLVSSVSLSTWSNYLIETPLLLEYVAADYVRVIFVALAALGVAVFAGYYLATHRSLGNALIPVIQSLAAFPAPAYFPLIFIATIPFMENIFPFFWTEIYIFILGFLSCFYYVFFDFWVGVQSIPSEFNEITRNYQMPFFRKMRHVIFPSALPYVITGLSSTINSAWAGIAIGEFWHNITPHGPELIDKNGMMYYISSNMAAGNIGAAAYVALLFAIVVTIYGIVFTRNLMDVARKKYVVEEGIFAA